MKKIYLITFLLLIFTVNTFAIDTNTTPIITNSLMEYQDYDNFIISIDLLGFQTFNSSSLFETRTSIYELMGSPDEPFALQNFSVSVGINLDKKVEKASIGVIVGSKSMTFTKHSTETKIFNFPIYYSDNEGYSTILEEHNKESNEEPFIIEGDIEALFLYETYGFTVNYQIFKPYVFNKLYEWSGLSFGSGFIYNTLKTKNQIDMAFFFADAFEGIELAPGSFLAHLDQIFATRTVPLEVTTGFKLFSILTITSGIALDIQISSLDGSFYASGPEDSSFIEITNKIFERISTEIYGDFEDELFYKPKLNIGAGLGLGPVVWDVSLSYYLDSGITFGSNVVVRF